MPTVPLWPWFRVRVHHDSGNTNIYTPAPNADSAKHSVMAAERCPECSIKSIRQLKRKPKWL